MKTQPFENPEKAKEWANQKFQNWRASLNSKEVGAIKDYMTFSENYQTINAYMRGLSEGDNETKTIVENIKSAIDKAQPLEQEIIVYRGMGYEHIAPNLEELKEVSRFDNKSFTSSSFDVQTARQFASINQINSAIFEIHVPIGTRGVYGDLVSQMGESEFLLQSGLKFSILEVRSDPISGLPYIIVEIIK